MDTREWEATVNVGTHSGCSQAVQRQATQRQATQRQATQRQAT